MVLYSALAGLTLSLQSSKNMFSKKTFQEQCMVFERGTVVRIGSYEKPGSSHCVMLYNF